MCLSYDLGSRAKRNAAKKTARQGPNASQPLVFFAFFPPATTPACLLLSGCVSARPSRCSRGATRYAGRLLLFLMSSPCSYSKQISRQFCAQLLRHRHLRKMLSSSRSCGKYVVPFFLRKIHAQLLRCRHLRQISVAPAVPVLFYGPVSFWRLKMAGARRRLQNGSHLPHGV